MPEIRFPINVSTPVPELSPAMGFKIIGDLHQVV
jgi:hypothetical protein